MLSCILCFLRGLEALGPGRPIGSKAVYIVNGMAVCDIEAHVEAACKHTDPYEACKFLNGGG